MFQFRGVVAGSISLDGMGENEGLRLLVGEKVDANYLRLIFGESIGSFCFLLKHKERFLAFSIHTDDMDFPNAFELTLCLGNVEHGGEFEHHYIGFVEQKVVELNDIGCAIGDGNGLGSMLIATGRVDENEVLVGGELCQHFFGISTKHVGMIHAQQGKVMLGNFT